MIYIYNTLIKNKSTLLLISPQFETCYGYFPPSPLDIAYGKLRVIFLMFLSTLRFSFSFFIFFGGSWTATVTKWLLRP